MAWLSRRARTPSRSIDSRGGPGQRARGAVPGESLAGRFRPLCPAVRRRRIPRAVRALRATPRGGGARDMHGDSDAGARELRLAARWAHRSGARPRTPDRARHSGVHALSGAMALRTLLVEALLALAVLPAWL